MSRKPSTVHNIDTLGSHRSGSEPSASNYPNLVLSQGAQWIQWFDKAADHIPELRRALQFLQGVAAAIDQHAQNPSLDLSKKLLQLANRFIGQARCPSVQSCEKLAFRANVLQGWFESELGQHEQTTQQFLAIQVTSQGLQKLLSICEGADDKHGVLIRAVRDFARNWLHWVCLLIENSVERANAIYPVAMLDQSGLIDPDWWWKSLATCDRHTVLGMIEIEINGMHDMQPTSTVTWRSFENRWRRLRVKALLEFLGEHFLLAELLRKSAVDDFEAASAVKALERAGRIREAIYQAEQWMRVLPGSAVLAQTLFNLYLNDGWDDEALSLAHMHYAYDPNPVWIECLKRLHTPAAMDQVHLWEQ